MLTLVCLADTHGRHDGLELPEGDVLIHAGDLTRLGTLEELREANAFLARQPHPHKLVVAGNHDFCFERFPAEARGALTAATYLEDSSALIDGVTFYGSPWQPWFHSWAFNLHRGAPLAEKWARIPQGTQVLITHGPPAGFGDRTWDGEHAGCEDLLGRVRALKPRLHLFGHIHEDPGEWTLGPTRLVNVTTAEGALPPRVLTLRPETGG